MWCASSASKAAPFADRTRLSTCDQKSDEADQASDDAQRENRDEHAHVVDPPTQCIAQKRTQQRPQPQKRAPHRGGWRRRPCWPRRLCSARPSRQSVRQRSKQGAQQRQDEVPLAIVAQAVRRRRADEQAGQDAGQREQRAATSGMWRGHATPNRGRAAYALAKMTRSSPSILSREQLLHHLPRHVGKAELAALGLVGELEVIEAQEVQNRGVQVVDVHEIFGDVEA
jgi:hypothetical protein